MAFEIVEGALQLDGVTLLSGLPEGTAITADETGVFVSVKTEHAKSRQVLALGEATIERWAACHRYEPFWMKPRVGTAPRDIPVESQYVITQTAGGTYVLLVPILQGPFRASLQGAQAEGASENALELVIESGDPAVVGTEFTVLFIAAGDDPYALVEDSAAAVLQKMKVGRLRVEKELPSFIDQFGWCTWDSFYREVSYEKVRLGLESFVEGGVHPKLLILDDGWLSFRHSATGSELLTTFEANDKFPGGLNPTVQLAKGEFGVETFLVWHAFTGYWGGVDPEGFPQYGVRHIERRSSPGIKSHVPNFDEWWGGVIGLISPQLIYKFFHDFHRRLREQGVDGVKVDVQANVETVSQGLGGRVEVMRAYHEALEGSVQTHFQGDLINCMSCANEMFYLSPNSNLTRTSTDFWPDIPSSHGLHLWTNAQVSLWFGQFTQPDWDMFQSGHEMGAYHAAARAVSGGPVYVSDKPDAHNFDVLKKLVLPDGTTLRAQSIGLPTRDSIFIDPTKEAALLKIWNVNTVGGVLGVFNGRYGTGEAQIGTATDTLGIIGENPALKNRPKPEHTPSEPVTGTVSPADIPGLDAERFAVYAHNAGEVRVLNATDTWELTLPELQAEVFTLVPADEDFAPLGLIDMFNGGAAVEDYAVQEDEALVFLRSSGRFAAWSAREPKDVLVAHEHSHDHEHEPVDEGHECEHAASFNYDAESGLLVIDLPREAVALQIAVTFA